MIKFENDSNQLLSLDKTEMEIEFVIEKSQFNGNNTNWEDINGNHFILISGKSGSGNVSFP